MLYYNYCVFCRSPQVYSIQVYFMSRSICARFLLLLTLLASGAIAREQPVQLMVSIKPLALIAERIAGDEAQVQTLLPAGVSPHEFALRVSDMRLIRRADLALWVGPALEGFLQKPLAGLAPHTVVTAAELDAIVWPVARGAGHSAQAGHEGHTHEHGRDPHVWLNPDNALIIARELAQRLGQLRPSQAQVFSRRAAQFAEELAVLDREITLKLEPVKDRGFAVYHDGYRHFVARYQLKQVDYVTLTPERRPGARHLYELEKHLQSEAVCLFVEPYADTAAASALAERAGLRTGILDPLASDVAILDYRGLMTGLAAVLAGCLQGANA